MLDESRRTFVLRSIASVFIPQMAGCCLFIRHPKPVCPKDPTIDDPNAPLTIDIHAHVFSASDLQVSQFISRVSARGAGHWKGFMEVFGEILQSIGWATAPSGKEELKALEKFSSPNKDGCPMELENKLDEWGDMQYRVAVGELEKAMNKSVPELVMRVKSNPAASEYAVGTARAVATIQQLPASYKEYRALLKTKSKGVDIKKITFDSAVDFIIEHFQYRYVSVNNYLRTFDDSSIRKIDLVIAHLVDYDWWLNNGAQPPTPMEDQIEIMERISILTGGRVHAFVPYCPYRQVMHEKMRAGGRSPLEIVQTAILEKGALGAKLYPPMGFAPIGNEKLEMKQPGLWRDKKWLDGEAKKPGFGKLLDDALRKLYSWCSNSDFDVPLLAHSNLSNGPDPEFDHLGDWTHWKAAVAEFPNLRIAFGHFGDPSGNADGDAQSRGLMSVIGKKGDVGQNVYADASYYTDVLDNPKRLTRELVDLFSSDEKSGSGVLSQRLMYGTDWKMMLIEEGNSKYLSDLERLIPTVVAEAGKQGLNLVDLPGNFFSANAVNFLGLKTGKARERIDAFYKKRMPNFTPSWMAKL